MRRDGVWVLTAVFSFPILILLMMLIDNSRKHISYHDLDCWLLEDGFVAQEGWKIAHLADRGARNVELSLKPDTVICYPVDKDGLPAKEGHKMRFWYRREK